MIPNTAAMMTKFVPPQQSASPQQNRYVRQFSRKEKPMCTHCGMAGHTVDKCYKLHGFPPGFKFTRRLAPSAHSVIQNNKGISSDSSSSTPQLPITAEQC
jgi:hypothetical protein